MRLLSPHKVLRSPFSNNSPQSRALQHQPSWLKRRLICGGEDSLLRGIEISRTRIDRHRDWQGTETAGSGSIRPIVGVAGEKQEKVVDEATAVLLSKLPLDSDIQRAKAAFDQAQAVEEGFQRDFSRVDFTNR
jgi:hypothetical protein